MPLLSEFPVVGPVGPAGPQGRPGADGKDAAINGQNAIEIVAGDNINIDQSEPGKLKISVAGVYSRQESNNRFALALKTTDSPGASLQIYPDAESNMTITAHGYTTHEGEGDPSPNNVRPIKVGGVRLKKVVLDGSENWAAYTTNSKNIVRLGVNISGIYLPAVADIPKSKCNRYKTVSANDTYGRHVGMSQDWQSTMIFIYDDCYNTREKISEWKTYLSKNPITVWLEMADGSGDLYTPIITEGEGYHCECLSLNEPLCEADYISSDGTENHVWKLLTFDGTEEWYISDPNGPQRRFDLILPASATAFNLSICSHATVLPAGTESYDYGRYYVGTGYTGFYDPDSVWADTNAFKAYLSSQYSVGTPVQLLYKLATPVSSSGSQIQFLANPTTDGSVTITGENTVSATYNKSVARAIQELQAAIQVQNGAT